MRVRIRPARTTAAQRLCTTLLKASRCRTGSCVSRRPYPQNGSDAARKVTNQNQGRSDVVDHAEHRQQQERILQALLRVAVADPRVLGVTVTGSYARGQND